MPQVRRVKAFCPQPLRDGRLSSVSQDRFQGICPKCGASGPKRESQQEALLPQKIFFLVLLRANQTTRKTADNKLRQTITTIMALAAFPLATETQAQLENQPSREAEPVSPLRNRDNSRLETSSQETRKLHAEAEKGGNAPPFLLFLWLMGGVTLLRLRGID